MDAKIIISTAQRIADLLNGMDAAKLAPSAARKELAAALIGHRQWDSPNLRPIRSAALHRAALDAVTDKLVTDLAAQKREELGVLAEAVDRLRHTLVEQAEALRFALLDEVRAAREWQYAPDEGEA